MEVIYLIFVFTWKGTAFAEKVPQASIEQCEENGAALVELHRGINFRCIPGLAHGSGTPMSPEELMSRYGFKGSTY